MLRHLGETDAADRILAAVRAVLAAGRRRDLRHQAHEHREHRRQRRDPALRRRHHRDDAAGLGRVEGPRSAKPVGPREIACRGSCATSALDSWSSVSRAAVAAVAVIAAFALVWRATAPKRVANQPPPPPIEEAEPTTESVSPVGVGRSRRCRRRAPSERPPRPSPSATPTLLAAGRPCEPRRADRLSARAQPLRRRRGRAERECRGARSHRRLLALSGQPDDRGRRRRHEAARVPRHRFADPARGDRGDGRTSRVDARLVRRARANTSPTRTAPRGSSGCLGRGGPDWRSRWAAWRRSRPTRGRWCSGRGRARRRKTGRRSRSCARARRRR